MEIVARINGIPFNHGIVVLSGKYTTKNNFISSSRIQKCGNVAIHVVIKPGFVDINSMRKQGITFEKVRRVKNRSPKMMISRVASGLLN